MWEQTAMQGGFTQQHTTKLSISILISQWGVVYFSNAPYCFSATASCAYKASPNYLNVATDIWREDGAQTVKTGLILHLTLGQAQLVNSRVTALEYFLQYLNTVLHNNRVTYTSLHHTTYLKYCKTQVGFVTSSSRILISWWNKLQKIFQETQAGLTPLYYIQDTSKLSWSNQLRQAVHHLLSPLLPDCIHYD